MLWMPQSSFVCIAYCGAEWQLTPELSDSRPAVITSVTLDD
jgi:hypothetical protein